MFYAIDRLDSYYSQSLMYRLVCYACSVHYFIDSVTSKFHVTSYGALVPVSFAFFTCNADSKLTCPYIRFQHNSVVKNNDKIELH